ncbi:TlpA family protein disulfide reductase [Clostridium sp. Marseille-P2415]|uniref:TlpA family protein disulfide reductase n=1 Tax=Clostridium sp. Marseille-P2415 TaxID=1805471 RepID=UPI001F2FD6E1|nr:TlpA disulfide reductase family protein [Clostridium sp. Marseille-P2415]
MILKVSKKMITIMLTVCMGISMLAGCKSADGGKSVEAGKNADDGKSVGDAKSVNQSESDIVVTDVKERGLSFSISQEYIDKGVELESYNENLNGQPIISIYYYYKPITDKLFSEMIDMKPEDRTKEVEDAFNKKMAVHSKCIMNIVLLTEDEYKQGTDSGKSLDDLSGFNNTEKFGENDKYIYLLSIPTNDTEGMSEEEKLQYEECRNYMTTVKENLKFMPIQFESNDTVLLPKMPAFTAKDLNGNTVTESIFAKKDLTVVNIWGTFCGPCIEEMPELGKWAKSMPDNVQIVGLVSDIDGDSDKKYHDLAVDIVTKANADFTQIIANDDFKDLMSGIVGVPTTFFVDKEGNVVGDPIVGDDIEGYKKFVEEYLNEQ